MDASIFEWPVTGNLAAVLVCPLMAELGLIVDECSFVS
jgi:hypothetical protein